MKANRLARRFAAFGFCMLAAQAVFADPLIISEFRVRGPNGANDEFIEIYNNTSTSHTVTATTGTGYGVAASDGAVRFTIPNGTVIPAHGHFLGVNSVGYSLASYPAGNGTTATGDATYTTDIADNAGIAIFTTNIPADFSLATRMDAVGSNAEANTLYKEGTGYPALTPFPINYSFYRDQCGKGGSITTFGACPSNAVRDTNNNAADFIFVDTNGTSAGAGQRLGAPGPQNLSSPINNGSADVVTSLDTCATPNSPPNAVRDFTSDSPNNSTFGTEDLRFTYTNNSGTNLTRLRFRIVDITTFPAPGGIADLRPRTSTPIVVTVDRPPCGSGSSNITVQGTTLEQPPSQPNGSGFNGSLSVNSITPATPLANGASVDVRVLNGIQQTGSFKLGLIPEGLSEAGASVGGGVILLTCNTDAACPPPTVTSIVRANPNPTSAASVDYTVIFSESVTGVDVTDFALTTTGVSGASVTGVSGSGTTYTVTVNTGSGDGTIRLDVIDDDTIFGTFEPLGGSGAGNGNFTTGEIYNVDHTPPSVTIEQAAAQADPATTSPINFSVTFSEAVTGFDATDVVLGGTAGATTAVVSGGPSLYNVAVSGMTAPGTVTASLAAGAATDGAGNLNTASTSTDNSVTFAPPSPSVVSSNRADADPTAAASVNFTVTFDMPVTGVDASDFALTTTGSIAGASVTGVSGSGPTYTVAVNTGTGSGTIRLDVVDNDSIVSGVAPLGGVGAGNGNFTTGQFYTIDRIAPTVTVEQAATQADPATTTPINFTVTFSEAVTGFDATDVAIGGTAGASAAVVSGGPSVYNVAISGMTSPGTVTVSLAGGAAVDSVGNPSAASTSTDNTVTFAPPTPSVTSSNRADADPTAAASVNFTVAFNLSVTGVDTTDFALTTTGSIAGASVTGVSGSGNSYTVTVNTGSGSGTIRLDVVDDDSIVSGVSPLGGPGLGNGNFTSGQFYTIDRTAPSVTIDQAASQTDPATTSPVNFTVTFSEPVTGFTGADVVIGGTAGATTAVVTGGPAVYNVAVSGMTGNGTVTVSVPAGAATDASGNANTASTSVDNTVTFTASSAAAVVALPMLSPSGLLLLVLGCTGLAWSVRRHQRR